MLQQQQPPQHHQQQSGAISLPTMGKSPSVSSGLSSTSNASLSTSLASSSSLTEQTVIHRSESDLTSSFNLSQQSLSATKLTDSSTTEGTLGPDEEEEEEREAEIASETQLLDVAGVETGLVAGVESRLGVGAENVLIDAAGAEIGFPDDAGADTAGADPSMSTSVTSIASNVVKDLLGDAMTESLTLPMTSPMTSPPRKTSEMSAFSTASANEDGVGAAVVVGVVDDDSYDDEEDAGGSISDCGKGYHSSDDIPTGCTTSDEREETATSSDIEIISNPSIMDGDVNDRRYQGNRW